MVSELIFEVSNLSFSSRFVPDQDNFSMTYQRCHVRIDPRVNTKQEEIGDWKQDQIIFRYLAILLFPPVALEDWFEAGVAAEDGCLFPCLIELNLIDCPKLKELPYLPPKLKSLKIGIMRWKTLEFL
ncbi:hypothetical protein IEQ34_026498 [Dendrobium chrysotoxum]|uniref:Uncharacterized protein n=1 Tax=Dendrobium chrysotoxum TaxID=161865 RepID=A0AAV7FLG4_DENCH|nr:hypothetical protein IEQ34_026498 [Dendrobium chrysotoxum]